MDLPVGTSVGQWRLAAALGRGGSAVVYEGVAADGQRRAIKVFRTTDAEVARRVDREYRALQRVAGPGVVGVHGMGVHRSHPYLVLDRINGLPLLDGLAAAGLTADRPFAERWPELARVFGALCATLRRLHDAGIVHRDLSPANVLLADGHPVLLDLGLVRGLEAGSLAAPVSAVAGTRGFVAPEQLDGAPPAPAADVFAFGALLYEALAGRPAFTPDLAAQLLEVHRGPPPIPSVPWDVDARVRGLLHPDPAARDPLSRVTAWLADDEEVAPPPHAPPLPWLGNLDLKRALADLPVGVWYVTGPSGSGKSRALAEVARVLRSRSRAVRTIGEAIGDPSGPAAAQRPGAGPMTMASLRSRRAARVEARLRAMDVGDAVLLADDLDARSREDLELLDGLADAGVPIVAAGHGRCPWDAARVFVLAPLVPDDLLDLLRPSFTDDRGVREALCAACGASPSELSLALARAEALGLLVRAGQRWRVRGPVDADRLSELAVGFRGPFPPEERAVCAALAELGGRGPIEVVLALADHPEAAVLEAVENLLDADRVMDVGDGWLQLRAPVTASPLPPHRAERALATLAESGRTGGAVDHLRARCAIAAGDPSAAESWLARAAVAFERELAPALAVEAATALAETGSPVPADVRIAAARAAQALGRMDDARAWIASVPGWEAHLVARDIDAFTSGEPGAVEADLRAVLADGGGAPEVAGEAAFQLGRLLVGTGRAEDGITFLARAVRSFERAGDPERRDRASSGLAFAWLADGRPVQALHEYEGLARRLAPGSLVRALADNGLASAAFVVGRVDDALAARGHAIATFRALGSWLHLAEALASLAHVRSRAGLAVDDALDEVEGFVERFKLVDVAANIHRVRAELAMRHSRWDDVFHHGERVSALAAAHGRTHLDTFGRIYQCVAAAQRRDVATPELVARTLARLPTVPRFNLGWEGLGAIGWALRQGWPAESTRVSAQAREAARRWLAAIPDHPRTPTLAEVLGAPGAVWRLDRVLTDGEAARVWRDRVPSEPTGRT